MALTIKNLLKVPYASRLELVTGEVGLNNIILRTHVLEIIEYMDFVQKGDLIITIGYVLDNNKSLWQEFIYQLYEREVAGIVIDTERIKKDTVSVIERACSECGCPLFIMPVQMRTADLQQSISKVIYDESTVAVRAEKFFLEMMYNDSPISQGKINRARKYGFMDKDNYYLVDIMVDIKSFDDNDPNKMYTGLSGDVYKIFSENPLEKLRNDVDSFVKNIIDEWGGSSFVMTNDDRIVLLVSTGKSAIDEVIRRLCDSFDESLIYTIGVSASFKGIESMAQHYEQAVFARRYATKNEPVSYYEKLGILAIIHNCQDGSLLPVICKGVLGSVINDSNLSRRSESIETLSAFFECNCNYEETAKVLFCHGNTVRNRIADIFKRLGLDKNNFNDLFDVKIALKIYENQRLRPN